ncbi:hypothetical protein [Cysteiniphilum halobium]|uniref:hypothetical protein n=1 Tax=Cysteiniphilum halobium TaxID=2219059 RepID=UPI003F82DD3A
MSKVTLSFKEPSIIMSSIKLVLWQIFFNILILIAIYGVEYVFHLNLSSLKGEPANVFGFLAGTRIFAHRLVINNPMLNYANHLKKVAILYWILMNIISISYCVVLNIMPNDFYNIIGVTTEMIILSFIFALGFYWFSLRITTRKSKLLACR